MPLDDDVTYDMLRKNDRSSGKTRSRSSKGKRPAGFFSRTVSRTTMGSTTSGDSPAAGRRSASTSIPNTPAAENPPSLEDLEMEEHRLREEEDDEVVRKKQAADQLARHRGLRQDSPARAGLDETKPEVAEDERYPLQTAETAYNDSEAEEEIKNVFSGATETRTKAEETGPEDAFVPARLPFF